VAIEGLGQGDDLNAIRAALGRPSPDGILKVAQAMRLGMSDTQIHASARSIPGSSPRSRHRRYGRRDQRRGLPASPGAFRRLKSLGFSDARLARLTGLTAAEVTQARRALAVRPVFKRIDTCAAEFASPTAYMYSTYEPPFAGRAADEADPRSAGSGDPGRRPNRIGQGIGSIIAAAMRRSRCARPASRPS